MDREMIERECAWWVQNYLAIAHKYFTDGKLHLAPIRDRYNENAQNIGFLVEWEQDGTMYSMRHACLAYDNGRVINPETGDQKLCMNTQEFTDFILGSFRPSMQRHMENQQRADHFMRTRGLL
jgi:hypothetical protein